jgi:hypothetical protein
MKHWATVAKAKSKVCSVIIRACWNPDTCVLCSGHPPRALPHQARRLRARPALPRPAVQAVQAAAHRESPAGFAPCSDGFAPIMCAFWLQVRVDAYVISSVHVYVCVSACVCWYMISACEYAICTCIPICAH